jgi:sortase A
MVRAIGCLIFLAGIVLLGSGVWIPAKAVLAQHLLQLSWENSLTTGRQVKPWPWADSWPVGRLKVERLKVDQIVLEGESGEVLAFGPGRLVRSAPLAGTGHTIMAGHRDSSFSFLRDLQTGDRIILQGTAGAAIYLVEDLQIVRAEDLYLDAGVEGRLSLITCYPFDQIFPGTNLRYLVTARRMGKTVVT